MIGRPTHNQEQFFYSFRLDEAVLWLILTLSQPPRRAPPCGAMPVTNAQVKMARAALDWTVRDLAEATGLHRNTINNVEVGRYAATRRRFKRIEKTLAAAGGEFIDENGGSPGVRLRKRWWIKETSGLIE